MTRQIVLFLMIFLCAVTVQAEPLYSKVVARHFFFFLGMPGRPGADMIPTENTFICDQLRCNGLRTGQVPFSGPSLVATETCIIQEKSVAAPFFVYEDNRFFHVISNRGELWQFNYRMQLRGRFKNARFPALEGLRIQDDKYLFVGNQEISMRQTLGNILWRNVYAPPVLWFPPLRVNDQTVIVHGNVQGYVSGLLLKSQWKWGGIMRVLHVLSGKTLLDVPVRGVYQAQRFPLLTVLQNQKVILPTPNGELLAFSLYDLLKKKNRVLWQRLVPGRGVLLSLTGDPLAPRVYVARVGIRGEKNISAIHTDTGAILWSVSSDTISTPLALYDNMIVFGTQSGRIVALHTTDGKIAMNMAPTLSLKPDKETRIVAISEPVVDSLGRVYMAFAAVTLNLASKLASNQSMEHESLDDTIESEVVGIQIHGQKQIYRSARFQINDLRLGKLLLGMETVGLFTRSDRMHFCVSDNTDTP